MEGPEGFSDWEQIQPLEPQTPAPSPLSRHVVMKTVIRDDTCVFPPGDHEDLRVSSQDTQTPDSLSSSFSPPPPPLPHVRGLGGRLRSHFGVISSGIVQIVASVRRYAVGAGGFRAFRSAAGGAVALLLLSLVYSWLQRWRQRREDEKNRVLLLLKEKDQKITQLLHQITRMSEMFSAARRVPVIRIAGVITHGGPI